MRTPVGYPATSASDRVAASLAVAVPTTAAQVVFELEGVITEAENLTFAVIFGLRITALDLPSGISSAAGSIDLIAVGFNTAAVPTPGGVAVVAVGSALARRRRRRASRSLASTTA
ncbi:MAG: hypothetical protein AAFR38_08710 [Planctomycetota bacterium]